MAACANHLPAPLWASRPGLESGHSAPTCGLPMRSFPRRGGLLVSRDAGDKEEAGSRRGRGERRGQNIRRRGDMLPRAEAWHRARRDLPQWGCRLMSNSLLFFSPLCDSPRPLREHSSVSSFPLFYLLCVLRVLCVKSFCFFFAPCIPCIPACRGTFSAKAVEHFPRRGFIEIAGSLIK